MKLLKLVTFVFHLFDSVQPDGLLDSLGPASFDSFLLAGEFLFLFSANSLILTNVFGTIVKFLGANDWFILNARSNFLYTWPLSLRTVCLVSEIGFPPRDLK